MNSARKIAVAVAALSLTLTGCTTIPVASPLGEGTCGADPVSLTVSEDTVGDQISIDYTGPSDVSLFVTPLSFYFDFDELVESDGFELNIQSNSVEDGLVKLNPSDPKWEVSSVDGGLVNWAFNGNIEELFVGLPASWTSEVTLAETFPAIVAVSCDDSLVTGDLVDSDSSSSDYIDGLDVAVAQAFYPRHSIIDSVNVINQEVVVVEGDEKLIVDFEFADGTASRFSDFDLAGGYVIMAPLGLPTDSPTLPATTFNGAWYNFLESCALMFPDLGPFCSPVGELKEWSFGGVNEWVIQYPDEMIPGEYLGVFMLTDDAVDPTEFRFAFTSFTFDEGGTFAIRDLDMGAPAVDERLAPTGGDPNVIIWAVLGGLVVLAAVFLRPKRRNDQAESTIDPSDKKK